MGKNEIGVIRRTVAVLDSVDYKRYSEGKADGYLAYASGTWTDERILIAPILFPRFVEQVLGFKLGDTIGTQEPSPDSADIPDYIPADTRTHPFLFDCKGMDTRDLSVHYDQISGYVGGQRLNYGILTNMRDIDVYTLESGDEVEAYNCSVAQLYRDYREDPSGILDKENTKRFLRFVDAFRFTALTLEEKLQKVAQAKPWTGAETLNIALLTKRLRYVVQRIWEDARSKREELVLLREIDPARAKAVAQEIALIASQLEPGRRVEEATLDTFNGILAAARNSLLGKALDLFFYRLGYFTMTRLLLARAWEDIGFIHQTLYDGGLAQWYENFDREIRRVLNYAFQLAGDRLGLGIIRERAEAIGATLEIESETDCGTVIRVVWKSGE